MVKSVVDPHVNPPQQVRSRATMERIVAAAEELLDEKPFEKITIAEISARSGSAPTAFYARFSDKKALLLEVHERFRIRAADAVATAFASSDDDRRDAEEVVKDVVTALVHVYRTNENLLRSVLLADNPLMYDRAAELTRSVSRRLTARIDGRVPVVERDALARDVDFAVRAGLGVLQQDLLYGDHEPSRFALDTDELIDRVATLLVAVCAPIMSGTDR
ncbi:TetR/AcrR family transcriptional regulator [Gordonia sp. HY285]|uniref:TetR/AcrR family transcriptional regulator n=1 Tax=Gordonia liuliyuniae TaxID=2911517 RepID=UPI001F37CCD6|nr:TetR/AcrR family transcriptional regulator [Gordonia liuliyuniae]MCF8609918.1 TetR/AcrR family transcriptional regulator [Gordonia liuliyuniae]